MGKADALSKPKGVIRKRKLKQRKKAKKTSFFRAIWDYLTTDTYMYGPLLSKQWRGPEVMSISDTKERPETRSRSRSSSPLGAFQDFFSSPRDMLKVSEEPLKKMIGHMEEVSETNGGQVVQNCYTMVRKTITTTTFVADNEQGDQPSGSGGARVADNEQGDQPSGSGGALLLDRSSPTSVDVRREAELTEQEADEHEEHSHENEDDFHDHIPLADEDAEKVANQLEDKFGGRFLDDLDIDLHDYHEDAGDNGVECWFLAANLFYRSVSFDVSVKTYKALSAAGVAKTTDVLSIADSKIAEILERTGYTKYGRRVVTQLKKLATHLEDHCWGRVSIFKHTTDSQELVRQLRSLPGVKLSTVRIFLRELRGIWEGAPFELDMKTKRAALHLKLLGSIKASSHPDRVLDDFANWKRIEIVDLEVALFKLGSQHEHHYDECEGGTNCKALFPAETLVESLPSDGPLLQ